MNVKIARSPLPPAMWIVSEVPSNFFFNGGVQIHIAMWIFAPVVTSVVVSVVTSVAVSVVTSVVSVVMSATIGGGVSSDVGGDVSSVASSGISGRGQ